MSTWTRNKTTVDIFDGVNWTADDGETIIETYWERLDEQFAGLHALVSSLYLERVTS